MRLRHSVQPIPGTGFIDPKTLSRIDNLELLARTVVDGFINGLHRAPYLGMSLDFAEHRAYYPGDDIRRIDWRLFARTDRYYVKEYEADTNSNFTVLLDVSKSMSYGGAGIRKLEYAKYLAASLSYFSREQRDRVGLLTFDSDIVDYVPPSAKHLDVVLHTIDRVKAERAGSLDSSLRKATELLRRRGLIAIISDLYEDPDRVQSAVGMLRHRGHDVIVFHVLDRTEIDLEGAAGSVSLDEATSFEDLETGERIPVITPAVRERYRNLMQEHIAAIRRKLTEMRIDYAMFDTSTPLDDALFAYLAARERLTRGTARSGGGR
ncbi:MAG TPA: DUF58 domain-containing protein [Longimicrobiales bacterium]|nr:DUF58 domain-containing protein [Longimicrobiales bacterium]